MREHDVLHLFDQYSYDDTSRELRRDGELVKVDPQQLDLLAFFLKYPGEILTREQIVHAVWEGRVTASSGLSVSVAKLRKALGAPAQSGDYIQSRYGRGYRFVPEVKRMASRLQPNAAESPAIETHSRKSLVGRAGVFEQLRSAAEQAQAGRGRLCLLTGEAGIGKTRLAECLEEYVQSTGSMFVVWGRCSSDASTPLWPIRRIICELAKHGLIDGIAMDAVGARTHGADSFAGLFGPFQCDGSIDHSAHDALAQCLIAASRSRPLLIFVDDIQWADSASLRVLGYVADAILHAPILLVCNLRLANNTLNEQREVSRLWNHRNCQRWDLQRLSARDVTEYVQARFGRPAAESAELGRALFERSEGNPFFMIDLLRSIDPAQPKLNQRLSPSSMALDLVREHLQDLPAGTHVLLSAAAVLGRDFDIGLLSYVTEMRAVDVLDVLSSPRANSSLLAAATMHGAFRFDHALIREVLYNELPQHQRAQLHLRAAQALLRRQSSGGHVTHAEVANHFLSAQPYGDLDLAIEHAQTAAAEASNLGAHTNARAILLRALDVLCYRVAPRPELRAALLLQLAIVERDQGDPAWRKHLAVAVTIAREHRLGKLLSGAGQLLRVSPDVVVEQADA